MLPGIALAIPLCCRPLLDGTRKAREHWLASQAVAYALAASAVPPSQPGAARHKSRVDAGIQAIQAEPSEAAHPPITAGPSTPAEASAAGEDTDFEILRIEQDLDRINQDPAARVAFYNQIDEMVSRVRSGRLIPQRLLLKSEPAGISPPAPARIQPLSPGVLSLLEAEPGKVEPAVSAGPAFTPFHSSMPSSAHLSTPEMHASFVPLRRVRPSVAADFSVIQSPAGDRMLDVHVVSRLLYWARKNNCPPELALATAWQESRMSVNPADGSSGEIGILQILPARAKAEGVDPRRLRNPDVDMWLGTKLLAQYYRQEGSVSGAAMKYVGGPNVFGHRYPRNVRNYIGWYAGSVQGYAGYFKQYVNF